MGEFIPVIEKGEVKSFINIGGDFLQLITNNVEKIFIFTSSKCIDISSYLTDYLLHNTKVNVNHFLAPTPTLFGYTIKDLDEFARIFAKKLEDKIKDKKIIVDWSGGKDSSANLVFMQKLNDYIPFKLQAVYVHIPFLENERNQDFVQKMASKLGVDLVILEPEREIFRSLLLSKGMPIRGKRWCTYQKIRVIRKFRKSHKIDFEVVSDRIYEAYKRLISLHTFLFGRHFISGSQLKPMFFATILDVVKICREYNVIHPDYLRGFTRLSCDLCPYRPLYEIKMISNRVEDPGFIESILRIMYKKNYHFVSTFDEFINYALWRYHPKLASEMIKAWRKLEKMEELRALEVTDVLKMFASIWREDLPKAPYLILDYIQKLVKNALKQKRYTVIYPELLESKI